MRIIHFSDTHLGHRDYNAIDSDSGINQREADIYKVFNEIIDYILETKPDLVIHAGDLFDNVRPSNKAISVALEAFSKLSQAKIPTVIIAGNHSTPRQKSKETIFKVLDYFENIHPIYHGMHELVSVGSCAVHAIPHTYSDPDLQKSVKLAKPNDKFKYNILVAHGVVHNVKEASWGEFKELTLPDEILNMGFDYIALGHLHSCHKIAKNAYYSGSPERLSWNEVINEKYFLEINLETSEIKKIPTTTREMKSFDPIDCENLNPEQIIDSLKSKIKDSVDNKIIRITFDNIPRHIHASLNHEKIYELTKNAMHVVPVFNFKDEEGIGVSTTSMIGTLDEEFEIFLKNKELVGDDFTTMRDLGLEYLSRVQNEGDDE